MKKNVIVFILILTFALGFYQLSNFPDVRVAKLDTRVVELSRFEQKLIYEKLDNYDFSENNSGNENGEQLFNGMYYNVSYQKKDKLYEWVFFGRHVTLKVFQGENVQEYSDYDEKGNLFKFIGIFIE